VQKIARYASFCLIMGLFKGDVPVFARLWPVRVRVGVSFTTGAVRFAILATAGLLVTTSNVAGNFGRLILLSTFSLSLLLAFPHCCRRMFLTFSLRHEMKFEVLNIKYNKSSK